jgi:SH3-like domain-containing protein
VTVVRLFLLGLVFHPIFLPGLDCSRCLAQTPGPMHQIGNPSATVKVAAGNLRAKPDLDALVIDKVVRGNRLVVIEAKPPWYLVELADARRGWVHESLISIDKQTQALAGWNPPSPSGNTASSPLITTRYTVRVKTARVRREPNLQADILFRLPQGASVRIKGLQEDWFLVEDATGRSGWAYQRLFASSDMAADSPDTTPVRIKAVEHRAISEQLEEILFKLSGPHPPQTFAIDGDRPRIVCDFANARPEKGLGQRVDARGTLIKGVRIASHPGNGSRVRVVLDLAPNRTYVVEQTFYKTESLFTLIIKSGKED